MGRISSIARLPESAKRAINRLIEQGGHSIDDIRAYLDTLGLETVPSRSALGRHKQTVESQIKQLQVARQMAGSIAKSVEENPRGDVGRMAVEFLQTAMYHVSGSVMNEGADASTKELTALSRAARELASAQRVSVETEIKIRDRIAAENLKKLDQLAKGGPGAGGPPIDLATLDEVRRALGTG